MSASSVTDPPQVHLAASEADLRRIFRLRYAVYVDEMSKPYPTADHDRRELSDPGDWSSMHLYATDQNGEVIAALRSYYGLPSAAHVDIFDHSSHRLNAERPFHCVSRFVIVPEARDLRIATSLAKAAYAYARTLGVYYSYIHCNPRLILLWTRFGYEAYRPFIDDPVVGCQVPMLLRAADEDRLADVKSPFLHLAEAFRRGPDCWNPAMRATFSDPPLLALLMLPQPAAADENAVPGSSPHP
jgi:predicted GNAT family N-acyltransferase